MEGTSKAGYPRWTSFIRIEASGNVVDTFNSQCQRLQLKANALCCKYDTDKLVSKSLALEARHS